MEQTPGSQKESEKKEKFDPKKPPDKSNFDDIYNYVAKRISGPSFRNPLKNFIDENCTTFIDVDENTFEQGQLFKELNQLLENLLDEVLKEGELTQEDFLKAAEKGIEDKKYKKYFNQVINFGDYNFFKSIMTKRNYQIIKMAEQQMENAQNMKEGKQEPPISQEEGEQKTRELVAKLLEEENKDLDEAIKQSLAEEDKRRRIAAIEEEEMRRALQMSLANSEIQEIPKQEEPKKEEQKKEEPKKEVPKKEEPKKFVPNVISNVSNFQFDGEIKPDKKEEKKPKEVIPQNNAPNKYVLEASNSNIQIQLNPYAKKPIKQPEPEPEPEPIKKDEEENKNEIKPEVIKNEIKNEEPKENKKESDINNDIIPKKEERITRDFVNVFEEKKRTLKPLANKHKIGNNLINNKGPNKPSLMQDLQKKKGNIKDDIERMKIKNENKQKGESAIEILKKNIEKDKQNNDVVDLEDDGGGLLINDDNDEEEKKNEYVSKHNIQFGKIAIPSNFNGKIPEYTKEKQEELKEFRDMVVKSKINERELDEDDI